MYNKLFTKILDSSVWLESTTTRIVWLTFIASMDEDGFATFAAVGNLANRARVTVAQCEVAIKVLESPDPESADPDHQGRRIERVPGGWVVLNAPKYRDLITRIVARERTKERVRKHRAKKAGGGGYVSVTNSNAPVTQSEALAVALAPTEKITRSVALTRSAPEAFTEFWALYPRKVGKIAALKAWRSTAPKIADVRSALAWQVTQPGWVKDAGAFIPHPATWLNQRRWEDEPFNPPSGLVAIPTTTKVGRNVNETKAAEEYFNGKLGAR